jgi:hypothetical protein
LRGSRLSARSVNLLGNLFDTAGAASDRPH